MVETEYCTYTAFSHIVHVSQPKRDRGVMAKVMIMSHRLVSIPVSEF